MATYVCARDVRPGDTIISTGGHLGRVNQVVDHGSTVTLHVDWHDGDGVCPTPPQPADGRLVPAEQVARDRVPTA